MAFAQRRISQNVSPSLSDAYLSILTGRCTSNLQSLHRAKLLSVTRPADVPALMSSPLVISTYQPDHTASRPATYKLTFSHCHEEISNFAKK